MGISLGISVSNNVVFPISFQVKDLYTNFDGHFPLKTEPIHECISLVPSGFGYFDDSEIKINRKNFGAYKGEVKCKLFYGKKNKLDNELEIKQI